MKHPHYDLIVQWAENPSMYLVQHSDYKNVDSYWETTEVPTWDHTIYYRLIPLKKYRVALFVAKSADECVYYTYTDTVDDEDKARRVETDSEFLRWLTDWVTYE